MCFVRVCLCYHGLYDATNWRATSTRNKTPQKIMFKWWLAIRCDEAAMPTTCGYVSFAAFCQFAATNITEKRSENDERQSRRWYSRVEQVILFFLTVLQHGFACHLRKLPFLLYTSLRCKRSSFHFCFLFKTIWGQQLSRYQNSYLYTLVRLFFSHSYLYTLVRLAKLSSWIKR